MQSGRCLAVGLERDATARDGFDCTVIREIDVAGVEDAHELRNKTFNRNRSDYVAVNEALEE